MSILLFLMLFGNLILLGRMILYLLEFLVDSVFIPLINWGYKLNNQPVNLELTRNNRFEYLQTQQNDTEPTSQNNDLVSESNDLTTQKEEIESDKMLPEKSYIDDKLD